MRCAGMRRLGQGNKQVQMQVKDSKSWECGLWENDSE